jgi:hypothetical protein
MLKSGLKQRSFQGVGKGEELKMLNQFQGNTYRQTVHIPGIQV